MRCQRESFFTTALPRSLSEIIFNVIDLWFYDSVGSNAASESTSSA
jgi:hypothetical protein